MSGEDDVSPVEQEYRREACREQKAMDSNQPGAKFSSNILSRVFDDDRSVGSAKSGKPLLAQLFFQNVAAKVAAPIGQASGSGDFPLLDGPWTYWLATQHPNTHKLSDHEKCNVECLNLVIRPFATKMPSSTSLDICSSSIKVPMQRTPRNRL
jgi:hypothetical protein